MFTLKRKFKSAFIYTNACLRISGAHPRTKRDLKWAIQFVVGVSIVLSLSASCANCLLINLKMGAVTEACRQGTLTVLGVTTTLKYIILLIYQKSLRNKLNTLECDYETARKLSLREQRAVREYAERGAWTSKLWLMIGIGTSSLFVVLALCIMAISSMQGELKKTMVFEFYVPFYDDIKYENRVFIPIFMLTTFCGYYYSLMLIGFDPLVPIFMLHSCGQLELVKMQIRQLFASADSHSERRERVARICLRLQEIYRFTNSVRDNFTLPYEMVSKSSAILIPITVHAIIENLRSHNYYIAFQFSSFLIGCVVHFYVPCYYSDILKEQSLQIGEELYSCGWESYWDSNIRKDIVFMLLRARKPLSLRSSFSIICLDAFTDMCRQSYAIFNLINAALAVD